MYLILILLLFVTKCESSLKLVFSDEFNENNGSIDSDKWNFKNSYRKHINICSLIYKYRDDHGQQI